MKTPKIKKLSSGNFHANIMIDGRRVSITEPTRADVRQKILEYKVNGAPIRSDRTLREAIDDYISDRSNVLSPSTIRGYRTIQRNRFQRVMNLKIDSIQKWQPVINAESKLCSAKTLKNAWGFINSVLKENGLSVPSVSLPQVITQEHAFLQPEQIKSFLESIKDDPCELIFLLALHGLRRSEILALDVKNSVTSTTIKVRGAAVPNEEHKLVWKAENKNKTSRRDVPILIPRVKELIRHSDAQQSLRYDENVVYRHLRKICKENGIEYIGLHGLRHSFASLCYRLGISEAETMRLGGWSDPAVMRRIYTHLSEQENKEAEKKLKDFFRLSNVM